MSFFFKQVTPRDFIYNPIYFKPQDEDTDESGRRRIHFRRLFNHPAPQKRPVTRLLVLLIAIGIIFWYLQNKSSEQPIKIENIRVEGIQQ